MSDVAPKNVTSTNSRAERFDLQGINILCTWPQNDTKYDVVLENIKKHFGDNLREAIVAEERHKDGKEHLHAFIKCKKRIHYRGAHCLDHLAGNKHGSYEICKKLKNVIQYVCKDGKYVSYGVDVKEKYLKKGKWEEAVRHIKAGKTYDDLLDNEELAGFAGQHINTLQKLETHITVRTQLRSMKGYKPLDPFKIVNLCEESNAIATWMNKAFTGQLKMGDKQMFIEGSSGMLKSTFSMILERIIPSFRVANRDKWNDKISLKCKLIIWDEARPGRFGILELTEILDGNYEWRRRNLAPIRTGFVPVIILSMRSLEHLYPSISKNSPDIFKALQRRVHHIVLKKSLKDLVDLMNAEFESTNTSTQGNGQVTSTSGSSCDGTTQIQVGLTNSPQNSKSTVSGGEKEVSSSVHGNDGSQTSEIE